MEEMNASASATEVDEEMSVSEEKGGKRPGRKGKKSKYTAHTADKYELYQHAVQSPETDVEFVQRVYRDLRGEEAMHFREDFCGTAILSATWVKTDDGRTAEGYDLDPEPIEWGEKHNLAPLGDAGERVQLFLEDARADGRRAPDVRIAQNFSYWIFKERAVLLDYFKKAHESLAEGGIFVIDLWGGSETQDKMREKRKVDEGFTYIWDQGEYFPGSGDFTCKIHFKFKDGTKMKEAFVYEWRVWHLTELRDMFLEAGFSQVDSYFEEDDDDRDAEYHLDNEGEHAAAWIAYLVGQK
ncbi:MAG: class I SAM-dependent methyltransferase [Planctomycetes bacterium]|nr:class I SAM-dependent methyltransferase [Planctomycetota bacterium]